MSASQRDAIIGSIRNFPGTEVPKPWAKPDQPFDKRAVENVLFAFKNMLVDWQYNKRALWVDRDAQCLKGAGVEIVRVTIESYDLKLIWCDGEWEKWEDLQQATELSTLKKNAQEKLDRAKGFRHFVIGQGQGQRHPVGCTVARGCFTPPLGGLVCRHWSQAQLISYM